MAGAHGADPDGETADLHDPVPDAIADKVRTGGPKLQPALHALIGLPVLILRDGRHEEPAITSPVSCKPDIAGLQPPFWPAAGGIVSSRNVLAGTARDLAPGPDRLWRGS